MRIVFSVITGCLMAFSACTDESETTTPTVVEVQVVEAPLQDAAPVASEAVAPTTEVVVPTEVPPTPSAQ